MLRLHILASGSGGNAAIVENAATGEGVLIDCGICKRDFFARAEEAGFDLGRLRAVVVTGCLSQRYQEELAAEIAGIWRKA